MNVLIVDNGTRHLGQLSELLEMHDVEILPRKTFLRANLASFDVIILSGGNSVSVINHDREYTEELALIREGDLPIIGICLGLELIAHAFGATLHRLESKEQGLVQLNALQPHQILLGVSELSVYEGHRWVVSRIKRPLVGIAASIDGYEILMHETKPIFGFQFHPEMPATHSSGAVLMRNCLEYVQSRKDSD